MEAGGDSVAESTVDTYWYAEGQRPDRRVLQLGQVGVLISTPSPCPGRRRRWAMVAGTPSLIAETLVRRVADAQSRLEA